MSEIITQKTADALQEMVDESFLMTSKIDRMQSVLDSKLSYNNTANLIHHGLAHKYSGYFADEIADLGLQGYDIPVRYGNVPVENTDYASVKELLYDLRDNVLNYNRMLTGCYKVAEDNMDYAVVADLVPILQEHNKIVRQVILLCNKIDIYGDNPSFDQHITSGFWILEKED